MRVPNNPAFFDEMHTSDGQVRPHYQAFADWLQRTPEPRIAQKRREAELAFHRVGITFTVYGEKSGTERLIPFDIIPRVIPAAEWQMLDAGLRQRVKALNLFLHDIYHDQRIVKSGVLPPELVLGNEQFRPQMRGISVPGDIYAHIAGIDVVRAGEGEYYVLEDNLRVPSGVSYMLENRKMMMRLFPELFARQSIAPVEDYPDALLENLRSVAPAGIEDPTVAVLTPGAYTRPISSMRFWRNRWALSWLRGRTCWFATTPFTCAPRADCSASMSSIVGSTMTFSIPKFFAVTPCWACPDCFVPIAPVA